MVRRNDKGLYAIAEVQPQMSIRNEDIVAWSTFRGKLGSKLRVGFMSQISPDGRHVITTVNDPGIDQTDYERRKDPNDLVRNYYVANFKDYRFLQVFYPTRGVLAWYSRESGHLQLPARRRRPALRADQRGLEPRRQVPGVCARAARRTRIRRAPAGRIRQRSERDPDPVRPLSHSVQRRQGRQARADRRRLQNGMSNSFPRFRPTAAGSFVVQARNGLLMRPDGQLFIVPAAGGTARRMSCNTPLMNSWHSFSPNGRWLVFSSKSRSPYTQMFLTHIDEAGNDSPAILIENATAANRAVNIPEFVNIPPDGMQKIDTPAADYFGHVDAGSQALNAGKHQEAIPELQKAADIKPADPLIQNSLGSALAGAHRYAEAIPHFRRAAELAPDYPDPYNNLGSALVDSGKLAEAAGYFRKALELRPNHAEAHLSLGGVLAKQGRLSEAIPHLRKAVELTPDSPMARNNLALALSATNQSAEAIPHAEQAIKLTGGRDPVLLGFLGELYAENGRIPEAVEMTGRALELAAQAGDAQLAGELRARLAQYQSRR